MSDIITPYQELLSSYTSEEIGYPVIENYIHNGEYNPNKMELVSALNEYFQSINDSWYKAEMEKS